MADLTTYTDDDLDTLRTDVATEQERRSNLDTLPTTIAALTATYLDGGGDPAMLP